MNELKIVYQAMGIDVWEVIEAASTKPFGYMPFYPGPGLGGHCIPIDPFYLTWKAKEYNKHSKFIELAGEINTEMPFYVISKVFYALNRINKSIKDTKILILGLAYKKNVDDYRESPSLKLWEILEELGAQVKYNDPFIPKIKESREYNKFINKESVPISYGYDLILISTDHDEYKKLNFNTFKGPIIDTRNIATGTNIYRA